MPSSPTPEELYWDALGKWGQEAQLRMLQEECAEAIVAVNKLARAKPPDVLAAWDALAEEVADVLIVAEQARLILGPTQVDAHKQVKLKRLQGRLARHE